MDKCDQEVYDKGEVVFITNTIRSTRMEEWVQKIAADSGQRVDWHQFGGRPVVKALGDIHAVKKAIISNKDMHDLYYKEALDELKSFRDDEEYAKEACWSIWKYNADNHDLWSYMCSKCRGRCMPQNHAGWDPTQEGHG